MGRIRPVNLGICKFKRGGVCQAPTSAYYREACDSSSCPCFKEKTNEDVVHSMSRQAFAEFLFGIDTRKGSVSLQTWIDWLGQPYTGSAACSNAKSSPDKEGEESS